MNYKTKLIEIINNVNMEEETFITSLKYKKEELDEMMNKGIILFNLRDFCRRNMENEIISNAVLDKFMIVNGILL